ncbi:hypothetical protein NCS52_01205500 [Fusarium sp. LHS14.1]|nr:hypothetical protein NCS52_01205500 [Fusarium sp. LHS14.1]
MAFCLLGPLMSMINRAVSRTVANWQRSILIITIMEQLFTRVIGYQPIEFVQGPKADGVFYPKDHAIPSLTDRQAMWNGAGLPPTDTPFQLDLPAGFNFSKYVWGKHGAEWSAIQKAGQFDDELRFTWAYKHAIPDGHPFVGDVSHADVAKVPRVLVLGYVIDPDSDFGVWNDDMMTFWRMVACWWASFCLGKDISLWEFLSG